MKLKELGALLREERLKQGLTLDDIKEKTKLSDYILQAIENGDASRLPVEVYAKSFIKSYIKVLGLDSSEVRDNLEELFPAENLEFSSVELRSVMTPLPSTNQKLNSIFIVCLVLLVLGLGWFGFSSMKDKWQNDQQVEQGGGQQEMPVADEEALSEGQDENFGKPDIIEDESGEGPEQQAEPAASDLKKEDKKPAKKKEREQNRQERKVSSPVSGTSEKATASSEQGAGALQPADTMAEEPEAVVEPSQVFRVEVTDGECWMRAEVDGQVVEKYLYSGKSASFAFGRKLRLKVGNATVVEATLNGEPYEIAGRGQVRVVEIVAEQ